MITRRNLLAAGLAALAAPAIVRASSLMAISPLPTDFFGPEWVWAFKDGEGMVEVGIRVGIGQSNHLGTWRALEKVARLDDRTILMTLPEADGVDTMFFNYQAHSHLVV